VQRHRTGRAALAVRQHIEAQPHFHFVRDARLMPLARDVRQTVDKRGRYPDGTRTFVRKQLPAQAVITRGKPAPITRKATHATRTNVVRALPMRARSVTGLTVDGPARFPNQIPPLFWEPIT
jgi:hypothetical protein